MNANQKSLDRALVKGGVLSPNELKAIMNTAKEKGLEHLHLGSRQDILFPEGSDVHNSNITPAEEETFSQNIISSYVSIDIFPSTVWLRGTTYLYILEQFRYEPQLKVNITDPKQRMVPLFSGELNFIASGHEDFWYLYLKLPSWENGYYPVLIYTWDIAKIAETIEKQYLNATDINHLFSILNSNIDTNNRVFDQPLRVPFRPFPYYEGMNKMGTNEYWLGLYWRNNRYDIKFLEALCDFCLDNRIGKLNITSWKSIIIKGIRRENKLLLEKLLGQYGINIRHSALELNWHLPVNDTSALELKKFLVTNFDRNDISTYGLTFGITSDTSRHRYFTSIMIEKNDPPVIREEFTVRATYNLVYAKNFDPNTQEYIVYAQDVDQMDLPGLLMELNKMYFDTLGNEEEWIVTNKEGQTEKEDNRIEVYQCKDCQTIYDPKYGDELSSIEPGCAFEDLPETYACPLCSASKSHFEKVMITLISS